MQSRSTDTLKSLWFQAVSDISGSQIPLDDIWHLTQSQTKRNTRHNKIKPKNDIICRKTAESLPNCLYYNIWHSLMLHTNLLDMIHFAGTRLLSLILSLIAASVVVFAVVEVIPGDPASYMLGLNAEPAAVAALRDELGLNGSLWSRYYGWISGMVTGDFGTSYTYRVPVTELVLQRIWISLPLALIALLLSIAIAFPVGLIAASRRGKFSDYSIMGITQLGIAIPNFWFAMLLVLVFAINLKWFGAGGFPGWENGIFAGLKALTLPAIALALPQASILARIMRSSLLETLTQDYIRSARAKGLTRAQALRRHALRNAMIPVLTIIGLQFSFLLAGAIIIENVFYLPGLGRLIFQSITQRDLVVVESSVMLLVFAVILVTFLVDLAYAAVDPRLRKSR